MALLLTCLYAATFVNYLLFHTLCEVFSINAPESITQTITFTMIKRLFSFFVVSVGRCPLYGHKSGREIGKHTVHPHRFQTIFIFQVIDCVHQEPISFFMCRPDKFRAGVVYIQI